MARTSLHLETIKQLMKEKTELNSEIREFQSKLRDMLNRNKELAGKLEESHNNEYLMRRRIAQLEDNLTKISLQQEPTPSPPV
jgi:chromosome segregation ATPase